MIIWSGRGIFSILVLLLSVALFMSVLGNAYLQYAFSLSFFVAGVFSWVMGRKWNSDEGKTLVDKKTGQEFSVKPHHSIFWIKMQYWGPVFIILGLLVMFLMGQE
ncbi:hypothetical protein FKX85_03785 [Echinicola soli]|uniref:DUF3899 domain-containing protein n=1 Tax=Echinicola soli TaxID=2591634 RepID=A0A514CEF9_9BACT|nr:hypothetical protein [Echinicola soli]QDH78207.1 hypothetical protein FKX85_03785 [Echinicola soli]